jgi:hypothetical protein
VSTTVPAKVTVRGAAPLVGVAERVSPPVVVVLLTVIDTEADPEGDVSVTVYAPAPV